MTKLADMKMTKAEKKENSTCVAGSSDGPDFPWGLRLNLDDSSLKKLGIKDLPEVGAKMQISGIGVVTSVSSHESTDHDSRSVEIQIQQLSVENEAEAPEMKDTIRKEYRRITGGKN